MSAKTVYTCDVCFSAGADKNMYSVNFGSVMSLCLGGIGANGARVHICFECATRLREQLNSEPIAKELRKYNDARNAE